MKTDLFLNNIRQTELMYFFPKFIDQPSFIFHAFYNEYPNKKNVIYFQ